jgi:hypothetical protein
MMNITLPLSDTLSLLHAPAIAEGKTAPMAKGLFLREQDQVYAGESAGFGVPVWKTGHHTVFPSLLSARLLAPNVMEKVYQLNLTVTWRIFGISTPSAFPAAMETITERYMRRPGRQQTLLRVRDALCAFFQLQSSMVPCRGQGECRVLYTTAGQRLDVTVDGRELRGPGELILLNEVSGLPFSRLRVGQDVREGRDIPAWQPCDSGTMFVNPETGLGFALILPPQPEPAPRKLACGREIARGLNWAGLSLTTAQRRFTYGVNFQYTGENLPVTPGKQ